MKTWFAETTLKFQNNSDEDDYGLENYVFVFQAQTNTSATKKAIKLTTKEFKQDFGSDYTMNDVVITDIYETTDDARS